MMASKGAIVPVGKVMADAGEKFDPKAYVPAVAGYYTAPNGQMLSFPFNSSTTVFYYNKDAFKAAGLDPDKPPDHLAGSGAGRRQAQGQRPQVPVHHRWSGWTQLESFSAWHNVLFATKNNGFGGTDARLAFNSPLHVRHIENLANMAKQGLFVYKGRENKRRRHLRLGRMRDDHRLVGLSTATSARTPSSTTASRTLPYYPDVPGAPQNTVIGGASLWVMAGKKPEEYKGVATFFNYLSQPEVQSASHKRTGYLPITNGRVQADREVAASTSRIPAPTSP